MWPPPPTSTLFPYTTLFRSLDRRWRCAVAGAGESDQREQLVGRDLGVGVRAVFVGPLRDHRSEEHTSELQSHVNLVCRLLLEKKKEAGLPLVLRPLDAAGDV